MSPSPAIRIVSAADFDSGTAQTPGSERLAAISAAQNVDTQLWGGLFKVEPGARTGIHHHGEQETITFVLEGESLVIWGNQGEFSATARAGDFIHVPARLPHMEINPSRTLPFRWVVVRSTATPIVVNLPDDTWPATAWHKVAPQAASNGRGPASAWSRFGAEVAHDKVG
ncbi:MAG: cupin domain-containing protein [Acetobacteraceae bacterium]|nr:cupin domain-containing protein [Acetobacteraceae bacterium]